VHGKISAVNIRATRHFLAEHWIFGVALVLGLALRVITMLGFPPAIWYGGDSVSYVNSGLRLFPGTSRESGYGLMLDLLRPFHSFAVVTGVQHVMGLVSAVLIYALLRHRYRLPAWGATLATLPVLLDVYVIQLEQEILADCTFTFLAVLALTLVLWWPDDQRPGWSMPAAAVLLGVASAFWPVGLPLLILLLAYMLLRKFGWRRVVATALAGAVPLLAYMAWFDSRYKQFAFNDSDGIFLWSRTMSFAECSVIKPPADLRPLCPTGPPSSRQAAPDYIWENNSPIMLVGTGTAKFSKQRNALAEQFAIKAIEAQPLAYADTVLKGWLLTFTWNRPDVPSAVMASRYQFTQATNTWADSGTSEAAALAKVQREYTDGHTADTREVQPFANFMIDYQTFGYLRGTIIGLLMLIGLGGIIRSWRGGGFRRLRGWGGPALFPWIAALCMEVVPPATADYSLRYVVPTIPAACLAAALAFARPLRADATAAASPAAGAASPPASPAASPAASAPAPAGLASPDEPAGVGPSASTRHPAGTAQTTGTAAPTAGALGGARPPVSGESTEPGRNATS
jgi:hypothetical protein